MPESRTSDVIRTVAETLVEREVGPLPSQTTQHRMGSEMKTLSRVQIRESIEGQNNLTIKYDGTTKGKVGHLAEVEVATQSNTFLVGISQQVGGTALEYVDSIKESCDSVSEGLLNNVQNTMTDRCKTNEAIDKSLENEIGHNINSFRCSMHPLDSIAKEANKALKSVEADMPKPKGACPYTKSGESKVQALIRVASKLFNNDSCGDRSPIISYLKEKNINRTLPRWVGNRFNILFYSAAILFFIGNTIVDFFCRVQKPTNDLQRAFVNGWNLAENQLHLRCLGIVGCVVTRPWMELASQTQNIMDMNKHYANALKTLTEWKSSPTQMILQKRTVFGSDLLQDDVWHSLTSGLQTIQGDIEQTLQVLIQGVIDVMLRQLHSQLPGGTFWGATEVMMNQAASCSSTNISGERNFGMLDSHLSRAPNTSVAKLEAKVMFKRNSTQKWLKGLPSNLREERINQASREGATERKKDDKKKRTHQENVRQRVRDKQEKVTQGEEKERNKLEELVESVMDNKFWTNIESMDESLDGITQGKARNILKQQVNFRTKFLGQDLGKHALSKCSIQELKNILMEAFASNVESELLDLVRKPEGLIGHKFSQRWEEDHGCAWFSGTVTRMDKGELVLMYDTDDKEYFMTVSEFLTDMHLGDISLD